MEGGRVERTWGVGGREVGDEGCTETNEHARKKPGVERETKIQGGRTWRGERKGERRAGRTWEMTRGVKDRGGVNQE